jgi:hypothetical protein
MTPGEFAIHTLRDARDTFLRYGDNHLAKDPPQPDKARVNYRMVDQINAALLALADAEVVGLSDNFPAKARLRAFIDTLGDRDDDSFVTYSALLGDLRALTKDN